MAGLSILLAINFLFENPHCHVLCTDGGFYGKGMFRVTPYFIPKDLERLFRYKVFKMLGTNS